MDNKKKTNGKWVTINGSHIFIKDGQTVQEAMKERQNNKSTAFKILEMNKRHQPTPEVKGKEYGIGKDEKLDDEELMKKYNLTQEIVNKHRELDKLVKSNPSPVKHKEAYNYAKMKYDESLEKERIITPILKTIIPSLGGELVGLDFRLKREDSLARKISAIMDEDKISVEEAKNHITDSVRYTSIVEPDKFTEHVLKVTEELEKKGFKCSKRQNNFVDEFGNPKSGYKDLNCNFKDKNGFAFELQFNTPEGMKAKEGLEKNPNGVWVPRHDGEKTSHFFYEQSRVLDRDDSRNKERLNYFSYRTESLFKNVVIPKNIERIKNIKKKE